MDTILNLENDFIRLSVKTDGTAGLTDKKGAIDWEMGPVAIQEYGELIDDIAWIRHNRRVCEQYPGRFKVQRQGELLKYFLLDRERKILGSFLCRIDLEEEWFVFRIIEIDEGLKSLVFPNPIVSDSLIIPDGPGKWIKKPGGNKERTFSPLFSSHYNMRWFGGLKGERGWICIAEEGFENSGIMINQLSVSPGWIKSLGRWDYCPTVRYRFTDNSYVGMAKAFKKWAMENQLHKTLKQKIEECPHLSHLHGGMMFSPFQARRKFVKEQLEDLQLPPSDESWKKLDAPEILITHQDVAGLIRELPSIGAQKGLVVLRGWLNNGFDGRHPDVWPPEPGLGTIDELKELFRINDNFVVGLHDNYADIYEHSPSFPRGIIRTREGWLMAGGVWDNSQAYVLNHKSGLEYLERNWQHLKTLNTRNMHLDTLTALPLYENYEQGNRMARMDELKHKIQLLSFLKENGQVVGSECGCDFGMPYVDYNGGYIHTWRTAGETIPLLYLVYHDGVFFNHPVNLDNDANAQPWWLLNMLWGHLSHFWFRNRSDLELVKGRISQAQFVTDWHARVGTDDMVSHRFLTEDGQVEETVFSSGGAVAVNFSNEIRQAEGMTLPPYGHIIRN